MQLKSIMDMFEYLKNLEVTIFSVISQKLDWALTFAPSHPVYVLYIKYDVKSKQPNACTRLHMQC